MFISNPFHRTRPAVSKSEVNQSGEDSSEIGSQDSNSGSGMSSLTFRKWTSARKEAKETIVEQTLRIKV